MKSRTYNGEARSSEKDFETLQLGAFATPGLLLARGPVGLTAESGLKPPCLSGLSVLRPRLWSALILFCLRTNFGKLVSRNQPFRRSMGRGKFAVGSKH
jgi:hypothetical protein